MPFSFCIDIEHRWFTNTAIKTRKRININSIGTAPLDGDDNEEVAIHWRNSAGRPTTQGTEPPLHLAVRAATRNWTNSSGVISAPVNYFVLCATTSTFVTWYARGRLAVDGTTARGRELRREPSRARAPGWRPFLAPLPLLLYGVSIETTVAKFGCCRRCCSRAFLSSRPPLDRRRGYSRGGGARFRFFRQTFTLPPNNHRRRAFLLQATGIDSARFFSRPSSSFRRRQHDSSRRTAFSAENRPARLVSATKTCRLPRFVPKRITFPRHVGQ